MSSSSTAARTVLGFDYGETKIGVAAGNTVAGSASGLAIIRYRSRDQLFSQIAALITEWTPDLLVVGRPLSEAGQALPVTALAQRFAHRLEGRFALPVVMVDERFSSVEAQSEIRAQNRVQIGSDSKPRLVGEDDAVAAAIILRQYLDEHTTS